MVITKTQFDNAARNLLGSQEYEALTSCRFNRKDLCDLIAKRVFTGRINVSPAHAGDLEIIRTTAINYFDGNGDSGLID